MGSFCSCLRKMLRSVYEKALGRPLQGSARLSASQGEDIPHMSEDTESATEQRTETAAGDELPEWVEPVAEAEIPPMPTRPPPKVPRGEHDPWAAAAEVGSAVKRLQVSCEHGRPEQEDPWRTWWGAGGAAVDEKVVCDHGPSDGYDVWAQDVDEPRRVESASEWTEKPQEKDDPWSGKGKRTDPGEDMSRSSTDAFSQSWQSQSWEGWSAKSLRSGSRPARYMMKFQIACDVFDHKKARYGIGKPVKCRECRVGTFRQYVGCDVPECSSYGVKNLLDFYKRETLEKLGDFFNQYIYDKVIAACVARIMYCMKAGVKRIPR